MKNHPKITRFFSLRILSKMYYYSSMSNNKMSKAKLFKLTYPDGEKDLYLGVDEHLSPKDLKSKYPRLHDCQFEQMAFAQPADNPDQ